MAIFQTYMVRRGDTLGRVARAFGTTVDALCRLNELADANRIRVGQTIKIKQVSDTFRVGEEGDTLRQVASRAGVDADTVARVNGGQSPDADIAGKPIVVPSPSPPSGALPQPGHILGTLSAKYETSGRGPGTVSTGRGDRGGASYGSYQLASNMDQPRLFLLAEGKLFAARFANMTQGTPAFTTAWKACASDDAKAFGDAQHAYIKRTHYDPQCRLILERSALDMAARSATLRDVVWSTAVQHGANSGLIAEVIGALPVKPDLADYDAKLIDAIYLERGRRRPDGLLAYFSKNSADVQEGVAARFRAERADAQAALAAERALTTLSVAILQPQPAANESDDAFLTRIASKMSDADVNELLDRYGDDETRGDFERGRKVLVALRRQTDWTKFELGRYDDPMILVWRNGTRIMVKRLIGTTEPAGAYAFGHERGARGSTVDFNRDGKTDLGRLRAGVYHFRPEQHPKLGSIFRARDIQVVDRDCNQDGRFTPNDVSSGDATDPNGAGTTMYIHKGGTTFTGSAGCQTLPPDDFSILLSTVGDQDSLSYILVNAS